MSSNSSGICCQAVLCSHITPAQTVGVGVRDSSMDLDLTVHACLFGDDSSCRKLDTGLEIRNRRGAQCKLHTNRALCGHVTVCRRCSGVTLFSLVSMLFVRVFSLALFSQFCCPLCHVRRKMLWTAAECSRVVSFFLPAPVRGHSVAHYPKRLLGIQQCSFPKTCIAIVSCQKCPQQHLRMSVVCEGWS